MQLVGLVADQLVQNLLPRFGAQDASEPLYVLTPRRRAAEQNRHVGVWDVDAFIQYAPGNELGVAPGAKAVEHSLSLGGGRAVGDAGHQQSSADLIDHSVELGEDDHAVLG